MGVESLLIGSRYVFIIHALLEKFENMTTEYGENNENFILPESFCISQKIWSEFFLDIYFGKVFENLCYYVTMIYELICKIFRYSRTVFI